MSISSKPQRTTETATATAFITAAPDGGHKAPEARKGVRKGKRLQITHTISEDMLERLDNAADATGQSRAALINLAIFRMLEAGV
ncbi:hypothetical protein D3C76_366020 [compost metagenome]